MGVSGQTMDSDNIPYRQSLLDALAVLNGRWVPAVLASLATGPLTFGDLQSAINDVETQSQAAHALTRKVLAQTLSRLQRDEIVRRQAEQEDIPFQSVWYELTPTGESLLKSLRPLIAWAQTRARKIGNPSTSRLDRA
jgi:DNA-binding HxlR family transcriptional regulator